ncbi:MAG: hypothetical protein ABSE59_10515 [Opitutaceae bacterium]|jgi:hypothetical protein
MDWLLNHPLILLFAAVAVANVVQKLKRANLPVPPPPQKRPAADADAAERTRRVQAEIRRKIAERAAGTSVEPPALPTSSSAEPSSPARRPGLFQELARQMAEAQRLAEKRESEQRGDEEPARQRIEAERKARELAEAQQWADAQRAVQTEPPAAESANVYGAVDPESAAISARDRLLADLREPSSLRRALLLREILGEPLGLR